MLHGADSLVKVAVLTGSVLSALIATIALRLRERAHRGMADVEALDSDADGVPDVYEAERVARERS